MNKSAVLRLIRDTAYSTGYGAKLNFATFDIAEKVPGLLAFIQLVVGVYALIYEELTVPKIGAILVVIGICALYLNGYQADKSKYEKAGKDMTDRFNSLKALYLKAKSFPDEHDFTDIVTRHNTIRDEANSISISKQVLCSDWYAHYKFFWQQEINWLEEDLKFKLFRDKLPLTFTATVGTGLILWIWWIVPSCSDLVKAIKP